MKKISTITNRQLEKDIESFLEIYSGYTYNKRIGKRYSVLKEELDVCDIDSNYLSSFGIEIWVNKERYPYDVPRVREVSMKIDRNEDWHISEKGFCCLDIDHELEYAAKRGINIITFYQKKIYPFFANSLYKMKNGNYANEEYKHHFDGIIQFYDEKLKLKDVSVIVKILTSVKNNNIPGRNQFCVCGKDVKFKYCHLSTIDFLKSLSKDRIKKDLVGFKKSLSNELIQQLINSFYVDSFSFLS